MAPVRDCPLALSAVAESLVVSFTTREKVDGETWTEVTGIEVTVTFA